MPVQLEIVSPARLVLSRAVDMVVMPGYEGDLAAMENHAPMIVLLRGGVIALHEGGAVTDRLFVGGGFAEITPDRCTILADDATPVAELSAEAARRGLVGPAAVHSGCRPIRPGRLSLHPETALRRYKLVAMRFVASLPQAAV